MNVYFLLKWLYVPSVEIVSICLANIFVSKGHAVHMVSFGELK